MLKRLELTLPWPMGLNNLYPTVRGRRRLSAAGRDYHNAVGNIVRASCPHVRFGSARLRLELILFSATRRRFDLDGRCKIVQDSLCTAGLFDDDEQVDELHVYRGPVSSPGSVRVTLEALP